MRSRSIFEASGQPPSLKSTRRLMSAGALHENGQIIDAATVGRRIPRMIDGGHDKAGVRQRRRRIVMAEEPTNPAMRNNNERKFVAHDRAILCADNDWAADLRFLLGRIAWIPHGPRQLWARCFGRHIQELHASGLGQMWLLSRISW